MAEQKATPKKSDKAAEKTKPAAAKKTIAGTAAGNRADSPSARPPGHRYRMIETAAYFIAERNGFQGDAAEHWRTAEQEIDRLPG